MASAEEHTVLPRPTFDKPVKVLIVVSPYYRDVAEGLLTGAKAELEAAGATFEVVDGQHDNVCPILTGCAEFLHRHLKTTISGETDDFPIRKRQFRSDCRRQTIAHGT